MGGIHQFIGKIQRKWKLAEADHVWYMTGGPCWGDYPPFFMRGIFKERFVISGNQLVFE